MAFSYDLGTDVGKMRLLANDTRDAEHLLEDAEFQALLDMSGGVVKRGAAAALDVIASNETLVLKAIHLLDLTTDGPKVAADLRKAASLLRSQADADDANANTDPGFVIAANPLTDAAEGEYLWAELNRGS